MLEKVKREATENNIVNDILKEENKLMKDKSIDDGVKIETLEIKINVLEEENKKLSIKTEELEESAKEFNSRNKTNNFEVSGQREIFCCDKCCLKFPSKETFNKHKRGMHTAKLSF